MYREKIEEAKQRRIQALAKADLDAYVASYDEKGAILLERGQEVRGREAICKQMDNFIVLLGPMHHVLESEAYWKEEDGIVTEKGRFFYSRAENSKPFYTGVYIFTWKEQPCGNYLLLRDLHIDD